MAIRSFIVVNESHTWNYGSTPEIMVSIFIKLPDMKCRLQRRECALYIHKCNLWPVWTSPFTPAIHLFCSVRIRWKSIKRYSLIPSIKAVIAYSNSCMAYDVVNTDVFCISCTPNMISWPPSWRQQQLSHDFMTPVQNLSIRFFVVWVTHQSETQKTFCVKWIHPYMPTYWNEKKLNGV